jgi:hypothetical protein
MWPSGDCIDRFLAIGVTLLARLRMTTCVNSVLRLTVASLIHWLSLHQSHPIACCYASWIRHIFSDCHHARVCIHPSRALLPWHNFVLNKHLVAVFDDNIRSIRAWCFHFASTCMNHSSHLRPSLSSVLLGFLFIHFERRKRLGDTCLLVHSDRRLARLVLLA